MTGLSVPLLGRMRRNPIIWSEAYDNAIWSKSGATVSADATAAPNGMSVADKLVETAATAEHFAAQSITPLAGAMTGSVYVKAGERTSFMLNMFGTTAVPVDKYAVFDLSGLTVTDIASGATATIQDVGNGWRRVSLTITSVSTAGLLSLYTYVMSGALYSARNYLGDGASGVYVWGAQLEAGPRATNYIATKDSPRTAA